MKKSFGGLSEKPEHLPKRFAFYGVESERIKAKSPYQTGILLLKSTYLYFSLKQSERVDDGVADDLVLDIDRKQIGTLIGKQVLLIGEGLAGIGPLI